MTTVAIREYFAKAGSHLTNDDARVIGPVLDELGDRKTLLPADVVEAARSTNNPLHGYFEWDDARAAEHYREGQASEIIRVVKVRYISSNTRPNVLQNFKVVGRSRERVQTATVRVVGTASVADAVQELDAWRLKYQDALREFGEFSQRIGEIMNLAVELRVDVLGALSLPADDESQPDEEQTNFESVALEIETALNSTEPEYDQLWRQFRPFINRFGVARSRAVLTEFGAEQLKGVIDAGRAQEFLVRLRSILVEANEAEGAA